MDVHDCGSIKMDALELIPGVTLTIEPGMYIPDERRFGAFAGTGVRTLNCKGSLCAIILAKTIPPARTT